MRIFLSLKAIPYKTLLKLNVSTSSIPPSSLPPAFNINKANTLLNSTSIEKITVNLEVFYPILEINLSNYLINNYFQGYKFSYTSSWSFDAIKTKQHTISFHNIRGNQLANSNKFRK
jgi:hypothetical protein